VPTTPVDNTVSNQLQETDAVTTEGNTHPDESENPNSKGDGSADKTMEDNTVTVVVDVDKYVPDSPVKEAASGGIAKRLRTRSRKAS
ncbi:hypothetical protein A2U01_0084390, partial [Trifolium medium]|nr:hypothetical protein [Trifolium medium]